MSNEKRVTVVDTLVFGQMVKAEVIRGAQSPETVSGGQPVRTVTTSMTTGNVNIRYVPRQPGSNADTTS